MSFVSVIFKALIALMLMSLVCSEYKVINQNKTSRRRCKPKPSTTFQSFPSTSGYPSSSFAPSSTLPSIGYPIMPMQTEAPVNSYTKQEDTKNSTKEPTSLSEITFSTKEKYVPTKATKSYPSEIPDIVYTEITSKSKSSFSESVTESETSSSKAKSSTKKKTSSALTRAQYSMNNAIYLVLGLFIIQYP